MIFQFLPKTETCFSWQSEYFFNSSTTQQRKYKANSVRGIHTIVMNTLSEHFWFSKLVRLAKKLETNDFKSIFDEML